MSLIKADKEIVKNHLESKKIVIIDFWAEWCGPCKTMLPIIENIADKNKEDENISFLKVEVDKNNELASEYGIRSIPTLIFFKDGQSMKVLIGLQSEKDILDTIKSL